MTDQIQPLVHVMAQLIRPRPGHRHVFTFNELMHEHRIGALCPEPRFVSKTRYLSRRFTVNSDGLAKAPRLDHAGCAPRKSRGEDS